MDEYPFIQTVPLLNSVVVVMVYRHVTIDVDGYCMVITCSLNTNIIISCTNVLKTKVPTLSTYVKLTCWLSITSSCTNISIIVVAILLPIGEYWIWYNDYILFMYQCTKNCNNYSLSICWPWVQHWRYLKQCSSMHNNWTERIHGSCCWIALRLNVFTITLALGSWPRQKVAKVWAKSEARESPFMLLRV